MLFTSRNVVYIFHILLKSFIGIFLITKKLDSIFITFMIDTQEVINGNKLISQGSSSYIMFFPY